MGEVAEILLTQCACLHPEELCVNFTYPYQAQFQAFFDATDKGEDMPRTSIGEALETFRVVFACDRSAAEGRPVKTSEFE